MTPTVQSPRKSSGAPRARRARQRWRPGYAGPGTYLLALLITAVFVIPLLLVVITSFKTDQESKVLDLVPPKVWQFGNYIEVFTTGDTVRYLLNSVVLSTSVVAVSVLVCSMAAFVIARRSSRVTSSVYTYLLVGMIAPFAFIPAIRVLQLLGLYGTLPGLVLVDVANQMPFIIMIYVGFIKQLPTDLDEAARIDGCGDVRIFFSIIFPLLRPVTSTAIVLLLTYAWNEFQNVLFLMPDNQGWTMPMSVFNFQGLHTYNYALVCADLIVTMLPVVIVYLVGQKYVISGMLAGAVKS